MSRGRLSSIDALPAECEDVVAWAARELAERSRTQTDIYAEFRTKLIALQGEQGLAFDIPAFSSFNRHSTRLSALNARLARGKALAKAIAERNDGESADDLTKAATLTIKVLILEMLEAKDEGGFDPKGAKAMADAVRSLAMAENVSSARRLKIEAELAAKSDQVIETVAAEAGLSRERIDQLKRDFLGVRPVPPKTDGAGRPPNTGAV